MAFCEEDKCFRFWQTGPGSSTTPILFKVQLSGQTERVMELSPTPLPGAAAIPPIQPCSAGLSPDGKWLVAATDEGKHYLVDMATQGCRPIDLTSCQSCGFSTWTGKDSFLLSDNACFELVSMPSLKAEIVYRADKAASSVEERVSPDGKRVIISEHADGTPWIARHQLLNLTTKEVLLLAIQDSSALQFMWSPSGKYIGQIGPLKYEKQATTTLYSGNAPAVGTNVSILTPDGKPVKALDVQVKDLCFAFFSSDEKITFIKRSDKPGDETSYEYVYVSGTLDWKTGQYEERPFAKPPKGYLFGGMEGFIWAFPIQGGSKLACMLIDEKYAQGPEKPRP